MVRKIFLPGRMKAVIVKGRTSYRSLRNVLWATAGTLNPKLEAVVADADVAAEKSSSEAIPAARTTFENTAVESETGAEVVNDIDCKVLTRLQIEALWQQAYRAGLLDGQELESRNEGRGVFNIMWRILKDAAYSVVVMGAFFFLMTLIHIVFAWVKAYQEERRHAAAAN